MVRGEGGGGGGKGGLAVIASMSIAIIRGMDFMLQSSGVYLVYSTVDEHDLHKKIMTGSPTIHSLLFFSKYAKSGLCTYPTYARTPELVVFLIDDVGGA